MPVMQIVAPILPGKFDAWKAFHDTFGPSGSNRAKIEDQMKRYKIDRQLVSLQRTPNGDFVIVSFEGENPGAMMAGMATSDNEFDKWFAAQIKEVHGIAPEDRPPGPPSELVLEITA